MGLFQFISAAMYNEVSIVIPPLPKDCVEKALHIYFCTIIAHKGAVYTDQWCTVTTNHAARGILD
jgi:hypothetical protein